MVDEPMTAPLFETAARFFDLDDWPVQVVTPGTLIQTHFAGDGGLFQCWMRIVPKAGAVVFSVEAPQLVPTDKRALAVELMHLLNWNSPMGCFEMNMIDGQMLYRQGLIVGQGALTYGLLKPVIYGAVMTMDIQWPEIAEVLVL